MGRVIDSAADEVRSRSVRRVLGVVLVLNLAVAAAKLVVGWLSSSISMVADGFHSLTDGASNVVGLIGMSIADRPPDEDHPYGHRKFETLAALIIGALLSLTAWEVLKSLTHRLREGGEPEVTGMGGVNIAHGRMHTEQSTPDIEEHGFIVFQHEAVFKNTE